MYRNANPPKNLKALLVEQHDLVRKLRDMDIGKEKDQLLAKLEKLNQQIATLQLKIADETGIQASSPSQELVSKHHHKSTVKK